MIALVLAATLQCRIAIMHQRSAAPMYGAWESCNGAEADANAVAEPGVVVWTEERRRTKGGWAKPTQHTEPELVPPTNTRYKDNSTLENI